MRFALGILCLSAVFAAGGCANLQRNEIAWQSLHAIDIAQTLNAAGDPCYEESQMLTRALIGEQPSKGQVLAWGVGIGLTHWWIASSLEKHEAPLWLRRSWDVITIGHTGYTIVNNHDIGVRPWGDNETFNGCVRR